MKKTTILIIGILSMMVISSAAALKTNAIVQCEDTSIVIETSDNITEITDFVPAPLTPRFMNCTVNFSFTAPTPVIVQPGDFPVNITRENNTDGTPFIVTDFPVNITSDPYLEDFFLKTPFVDY